MEEVENNEHCVPLKKSRLRKNLSKELEPSDKKNRSPPKHFATDSTKNEYIQNLDEHKIKEEPFEMKEEQVENQPTKCNQENIHRQELPKKRWLREASLDKSLQESSLNVHSAPSLQELNQTRPTVLMLANKDDYMIADVTNEYTNIDDIYTKSSYIDILTPTRGPDFSETRSWCSSTPNNTHKFNANNAHKFNGFPTPGSSTFDTLDSSWTVVDRMYNTPMGQKEMWAPHAPTKTDVHSQSVKPYTELNTEPVPAITTPKRLWYPSDHKWNESYTPDSRCLSSNEFVVSLIEEDLAYPLPYEEDASEHLSPLNLSQERFKDMPH